MLALRRRKGASSLFLAFRNRNAIAFQCDSQLTLMIGRHSPHPKKTRECKKGDFDPVVSVMSCQNNTTIFFFPAFFFVAQTFFSPLTKKVAATLSSETGDQTESPRQPRYLTPGDCGAFTSRHSELAYPTLSALSFRTVLDADCHRHPYTAKTPKMTPISAPRKKLAKAVSPS